MAKRPKTPRPKDDASPADGLPTAEQIAEFIRDSPTPVGRREIARAFSIKGPDRIELKRLLKSLEADGEIDIGHKRRMAPTGSLPEVTVARVESADNDGELIARPMSWQGDDEPPRILLDPVGSRTPGGAPGIGDRVLVRTTRVSKALYRARVIRRLEGGGPGRVVGFIERGREGLRIKPTDRRAKHDYRVDRSDLNGADVGDLVSAEVLERGRMGLRAARVLERLGDLRSAGSISLICLHEQDIPIEFPEAVVEAAERAKPVTLGQRRDVRSIPLVTIDGADARDFDDAVWANRDDDPKNPGGWRVIVAIADVAHYVRPASPLDREAYRRGNSVYFPDRVVPMLPEALSNGLCSLVPGQDRACVGVEMVISQHGKKKSHGFFRGLMRSAARLTYEQVQAARNGDPIRDGTEPPAGVIEPLYEVFDALAKARAERGALDLDLPERRAELDEAGRVLRIATRERLDSHRLIEELMILANVAAAETLEQRQRPCMYRVHETPDPSKVDALREFIDGLGFSLPAGEVLRPKLFNRLLRQVAGTPHETMVNELVLRCQSQACYAPGNLGHFGLALSRYAHFTSPIRRYSDLLVHRQLITALGIGEGGDPTATVEAFAEQGEHISTTERRAAIAERSANDRYAASFLSQHVGEDFEGRVTGVTRFGLFVLLDDVGADGLIPIRSLPNDYYDHDEARHQLLGRSNGLTFSLGERVSVRLLAVDPIVGTVTLDFLAGGTASERRGPPTRPRATTGRARGRPPGRGGPHRRR